MVVAAVPSSLRSPPRKGEGRLLHSPKVRFDLVSLRFVIPRVSRIDRGCLMVPHSLIGKSKSDHPDGSDFDFGRDLLAKPRVYTGDTSPSLRSVRVFSESRSFAQLHSRHPFRVVVQTLSSRHGTARSTLSRNTPHTALRALHRPCPGTFHRARAGSCTWGPFTV